MALGESFSRYLIKLLQDLGWQAEMVTPVPLSMYRFKERGYNQAALLAAPIAYGLGLPYCPKAVERTRETRSQVGLNVADRRANVSGAFYARRSEVQGKGVLLIDDVATSGSTLDDCARALLAAGAIKVYCLTLARAIYKSPEAPIEV
jgi:ComF family protein